METMSGCVVAARSWASWAAPGGRRHATAADTEDRVLANGVVFAVADGASRPGFGDVAATVAITEFARFAVAPSPATGLRDRVIAAVMAANTSVVNQAGRAPYLGMMTTLCAAVVWGGVVVVVSVGDSRVVLLRDGTASALLQNESRGMPKRFVGGAERIDAVACSAFPGRDGDRLVVLTDGLDCLSVAEIGALAAEGTTADAVSRLHHASFGRADDDRACVVAALGYVPVPNAIPPDTPDGGIEHRSRGDRSITDPLGSTRKSGK